MGLDMDMGICQRYRHGHGHGHGQCQQLGHCAPSIQPGVCLYGPRHAVPCSNTATCFSLFFPAFAPHHFSRHFLSFHFIPSHLSDSALADLVSLTGASLRLLSLNAVTKVSSWTRIPYLRTLRYASYAMLSFLPSAAMPMPTMRTCHSTAFSVCASIF